MKITKKNQAQYDKLYARLYGILGGINYKGETIEFYNEGVKVGWAALPDFTTMEARHILAEIAEVEKYDDFNFVKNDGSIRVKASEVFMDPTMTMEDINVNRGLYEGIQYQFYKNKFDCTTCGRSHYKARYPEQKELVDKLSKKS